MSPSKLHSDTIILIPFKTKTDIPTPTFSINWFLYKDIHMNNTFWKKKFFIRLFWFNYLLHFYCIIYMLPTSLLCRLCLHLFILCLFLFIRTWKSFKPSKILEFRKIYIHECWFLLLLCNWPSSKCTWHTPIKYTLPYYQYKYHKIWFMFFIWFKKKEWKWYGSINDIFT